MTKLLWLKIQKAIDIIKDQTKVRLYIGRLPKHTMEFLMNKMFTVAGVSSFNGIVKYRFANSLKRESVLQKGGHTEIKLFELPEPMTKEQAVAFVNNTNHSTVPVKISNTTSARPKTKVLKSAVASKAS